MWCAKCGVILWFTREELEVERPERCEFCKAPVSNVGCPTFHAFGRCTECSLDELTDCPFDPQRPADKIDPAMQPV